MESIQPTNQGELLIDDAYWKRLPWVLGSDEWLEWSSAPQESPAKIRHTQ